MNSFNINNIPLKLQSPHITTGDALHTYILEQIEKLGRLFDRISKCEMMLRMESSRTNTCEADVKIFVPGSILYATGKATEFRLAVTEAFQDVTEQLRRYKEKLKEVKPDGQAQLTGEE